MKLLLGKPVREGQRGSLQKAIISLKQRSIEPCLAVVLVGDDPASQVYVSHKQRACADLGIRSIGHCLPANTSSNELLALIHTLNEDPLVHGILCQIPLPPHLDADQIIFQINPLKDVDGLHPLNIGLLTMGHPRFMPCTPFGVLEMLKHYQIPTAGQHMVVVGRSLLVGRPLSILLSQKGIDATVTLCHSRTKNLSDLTGQADILVMALGIPRFLKAEMVKPGAVVIDVGINRISDPSSEKGFSLCGDVDFETVSLKASAITPVPGGVGVMTIGMLLQNTLHAAQLQQPEVI